MISAWPGWIRILRATFVCEWVSEWGRSVVSDSLRPHSCPTLCDPMDCSLSWDSPGDLPDPGIKPGSPALQADTLPSEPPGKPCKQEAGHKYQGRGKCRRAKSMEGTEWWALSEGRNMLLGKNRRDVKLNLGWRKSEPIADCLHFLQYYRNQDGLGHKKSQSVAKMLFPGFRVRCLDRNCWHGNRNGKVGDKDTNVGISQMQNQHNPEPQYL